MKTQLLIQGSYSKAGFTTSIMLTTIILFFVLVSPLLGDGRGAAQKLAAENSIEITGKAKRGYLGNVLVDDAKKQLELQFVTKAKSNKIKFDVYQFDYDLKMVNKFSDEQEVEKAKSKYSWFNFRGKDVETISGVTAEGDMAGRVVFKKKEITFKYNWFNGRYEKDEKVLDKLKPKGEDDKRYQFYAAYPLDEMGEVICLSGVKGPMKEFEKPLREFKIMRVNSNLDIVKEDMITFQYVMRILYQGPIRSGNYQRTVTKNQTSSNRSGGGMAADEEPGETDDWGIVFATLNTQGYGKFKDPNPTNYLYVRIGRDGAVKEKVSFVPKAEMWKIDGFVEKDGGVYFYGPSGKLMKEPEDAYYKMTDNPQAMEKGFSSFQIAGIKNGKALFVNAPGLEEFEAKAAKPDNQKKNVLYEGGKLNIGGIDITSSGDIFINGQEYSYDAVGTYRGFRYKDFMMLHFNSKGELVKCYGVDNIQKLGLKGVADPNQDPKYYPTQSVIFEGTDKNSVYWMQHFIGNVERRQSSDGMYQYTWWTPRMQVRLGKIDISGAKIGNFSTFGDGVGGGKKFYLMNEFPSVKINGGRQTVFIGEDTNIWGMDSSGDYLWLGKFDPEKM